jgi:hypothetical protein
MIGMVLWPRFRVKNVTGSDVGGDELSQIAQQWLIGRG